MQSREMLDVDDIVYKHTPLYDRTFHSFVSQKYLEKMCRDIDNVFRYCDKMIMIPMVLTYPKTLETELIDSSNRDLREFHAIIKKDIEKLANEIVGYMTFREFGEENGRKHYHMFLMLNGEKVNTLGKVGDTSPESVIGCVSNAWWEVTGNRSPYVYTYYKLDKHQLTKKAVEGLVIDHLTYVCKLETKRIDGFRNYTSGVKKGEKGSAGTPPLINAVNDVIKENKERYSTSSKNSKENRFLRNDDMAWRNAKRHLRYAMDKKSRVFLLPVKLVYPDLPTTQPSKSDVLAFTELFIKGLKSQHEISLRLSAYQDNGYEKGHNVLLVLDGHYHSCLLNTLPSGITLQEYILFCWEEVITHGTIKFKKPMYIGNKEKYSKKEMNKIMNIYLSLILNVLNVVTMTNKERITVKRY